MEPGLAGPLGPSARPAVEEATTRGLGGAAARPLPMEEISA